MDIKTLEQALKLQSDLTTRLTQSLTSGIAGKMPAIEVLLKEKEKLITRAQAEVDIAIKERDVAVSRWDERVAQRKETVVKLQKEMGDLKKQLTERKDVAKEVKTGKTVKKTPVKKTRK